MLVKVSANVWLNTDAIDTLAFASDGESAVAYLRTGMNITLSPQAAEWLLEMGEANNALITDPLEASPQITKADTTRKVVPQPVTIEPVPPKPIGFLSTGFYAWHCKKCLKYNQMILPTGSQQACVFCPFCARGHMPVQRNSISDMPQDNWTAPDEIDITPPSVQPGFSVD